MTVLYWLSGAGSEQAEGVEAELESIGSKLRAAIETIERIPGIPGAHIL